MVGETEHLRQRLARDLSRREVHDKMWEWLVAHRYVAEVVMFEDDGYTQLLSEAQGLLTIYAEGQAHGGHGATNTQSHATQAVTVDPPASTQVSLISTLSRPRWPGRQQRTRVLSGGVGRWQKAASSRLMRPVGYLPRPQPPG